MDLTPYIESCKHLEFYRSKYDDPFFSRLQATFENNESFDDDKIIISIYYSAKGRLCRSSFFRNNFYVKKFYQWLYDNKKISEDCLNKVLDIKYEDIISSEELLSCYFDSLNSALGFVRQVGSQRSFFGTDDLLVYKSIVILAWYGVSLAGMSNLMISDIDIENELLQTGGKTIKIPRQYLQILINLFRQSEREGFPNHKIEKVLYSDYVFRNHVSAKVSELAIKNYIRSFNNVAEDYGQIINARALAKNRLFCTFYEIGDKISQDEIRKIAGCTKEIALDLQRVYVQWLLRFKKG